MLVLVNGAFGIGKTTLVEGLKGRMPDALVFDPEWVGFMIRETVGWVDARADFQEYRIWQDLVVETVRSIRNAYSEPLLLPICLYLPNVLGLPARLKEVDLCFHHLLLCAPPETVRTRIEARGGDDGWARDRAETICAVHTTLSGVTRLDATRPPEEVLDEALGHFGI